MQIFDETYFGRHQVVDPFLFLWSHIPFAVDYREPYTSLVYVLDEISQPLVDLDVWANEGYVLLGTLDKFFQFCGYTSGGEELNHPFIPIGIGPIGIGILRR